MLGEDNKPLYAVDIEGVEIVNVYRHPRAEKLYITKAEGGYVAVSCLWVFLGFL